MIVEEGEKVHGHDWVAPYLSSCSDPIEIEILAESGPGYWFPRERRLLSY